MKKDSIFEVRDVQNIKEIWYGIIAMIFAWFFVIIVFLISPEFFLTSTTTHVWIPVLVFLTIWGIMYSVKKLRFFKSQGYIASQIESTFAVTCPYCNNTFQIPQQNKPFRVKCPQCGREGRLR